MKIGNWLSGRRQSKMIEVHHFKVFDDATGKWVIPLYKCSEARILELKGKIIDSTMEIVARASLDKDGCYDPKQTRDPA
jgi:hypothetical protein